MNYTDGFDSVGGTARGIVPGHTERDKFHIIRFFFVL